MSPKSAEKLLNKIMGWNTAEDTKNEHPNLRALASFGYDDYKQFRPSRRFIESLAIWLNQFPPDKKSIAYEFIKNDLLFITRPQIEQIVSIAYPDYVIPMLLKQVSEESSDRIPRWLVSNLLDSNEFKILHHKCLFAGLSDGSYIDDFRRSSTKIDHEQISRTHEINATRAKKIKDKLSERLHEPPRDTEPYFRNIFLIDDFSASGTTYLKEDKDTPNGVTGKLGHFFESITNSNDPVSTLVKENDFQIYLILYVATDEAIETIQEVAKKKFPKIKFSIMPIHVLSKSIKFDENMNPFSELVRNKEFGWEGIVDQHIEQGNSEKPYLGFDQCALPLILPHNAPNNSLPILHRNDDRTKFKGLFPRVTRHQ